MEEMIESLKLPKQILDKTEKVMSKLFGASINEFGDLFADKVRFIRFKNQVKIFNKTRQLLDKNGLEPVATHYYLIATIAPMEGYKIR